MDEIYVKTENWVVLQKHFKNKELVSVYDLIDLIDDLTYDYEKRTEEYEELLQDLHDNYKFVGMKEAVGYDETW